jgi:hypothetical protein
VDASSEKAPADAAKTRPRPAHPLDLEYLSRQALGDPGLMDEIMRQFQARLVAILGRVETSRDVEGLLAALRALGLAARGAGAWTVADLVALAETELRTGNAVNPERIDDIAMAVSEAEAWLAKRIAEMPE